MDPVKIFPPDLEALGPQSFGQGVRRLLPRRVKQGSLGRIGPFSRTRRQRSGIARSIPYTEKTGLPGCRRRLGPHRKQGQIAPLRPRRKRPHAIGAGGQNCLHTVKRQRRAAKKFHGKHRRQDRLMPHRGQPFGDFRPIVGRAGDKDLHLCRSQLGRSLNFVALAPLLV